MKSVSAHGLVIGVFSMAGIAAISVPASAGGGFESLHGGFVLVASDQAHAMKNFPVIEAVTPVPSNFDPSDPAEISLFCEAEVYRANQAVSQVRGRFEVELYLLDRRTARFERFEVGTGKIKADSDGYGSFHVGVSMAPFADRLQSGEISAWFRTHGSFTTKKGDNAALLCAMFSSG